MTTTTARRTRYAVVRNEWDSNGAHHVEILDTESAFRTAKTDRAARDVARQSVARPELTRWTRLDRVFLAEHDGRPRMVYKFTVSRLGKEYKS